MEIYNYQNLMLLGSRTIIQMVGKIDKMYWRFIDNVGGLDERILLKHGFKKVLEGDFFNNIKPS